MSDEVKKIAGNLTDAQKTYVATAKHYGQIPLAWNMAGASRKCLMRLSAYGLLDDEWSITPLGLAVARELEARDE